MAWLAVNPDGSEFAFNDEPTNYMYGSYTEFWHCQNKHGECLDEVMLPKGTIEKIIGRELTWFDEPVEIK
ncbi:MAG: fructan hydrolase [Bacteroidales bacterium]